jgi:hypothetical protein
LHAEALPIVPQAERPFLPCFKDGSILARFCEQVEKLLHKYFDEEALNVYAEDIEKTFQAQNL